MARAFDILPLHLSLAVLFAALALACTPPAVISTSDGREISGELQEDQSRPGTLVVVEDDGTTTEVPGDLITYVSHPGDASSAAGVAMATFGLITTLFGVDRFVDGNTDAVFIAAGGAVLLIAGTTITIWGLTVYSGSRAAEEAARLSEEDAVFVGPQFSF